MCAFNGESFRLALTQIIMLRNRCGMDEEDFTIYHVGELFTQQYQQEMRVLRSMPHVRVRDLTPWLVDTYGAQEEFITR